MAVLTEVQKQINELTKSNVVVIILNEGKGYEILGKPMIDWVSESASDYSCVCAKHSGEDILSFVKSLNLSHEYIIVLFDKTPLLTKSVINNIVEYCIFKNINACKLNNGYVFKNTYLKSAKELFFDSLYLQNADEFYAVENKKQLAYVAEILQKRIIEKHISNGVEIPNSKKVVIEPSVIIEPRVVVLAGNVIKGETKIKEGVILKENNVISDSLIEKDVCLSGSTIISSTIGEGSFVMPYCMIENSKIGKNCTIRSNNTLTKQKIKNNQVV